MSRKDRIPAGSLADPQRACDRPAVRPLTESETKTLFAKLANYLGPNLVHLVDTPDDVSRLVAASSARRLSSTPACEGSTSDERNRNQDARGWDEGTGGRAQGSRACLQCGREREGCRVYNPEEAAIFDSLDCRLSGSRPTIAPSQGHPTLAQDALTVRQGRSPEECCRADSAPGGGGRLEERANGRLSHPWQAFVRVRSVPPTATTYPRQRRTHVAERGENVRRVLTFILRFPLTTPRTKQPHVFRLHRSRVYYVRESLLRQAISVPRANLISLGVCLGKFSKTEKFRLHVTALDLMGKYAKNKVRFPFVSLILSASPSFAARFG